MRLTDQQALRIAELPEDYRVIGVDGGWPFVRKPTGQVLRIAKNGRLVAATTAAKRRLADGPADASLLAAGPADASLLAAGVQAATPYTSVAG